MNSTTAASSQGHLNPRRLLRLHRRQAPTVHAAARKAGSVLDSPPRQVAADLHRLYG